MSVRIRGIDKCVGSAVWLVLLSLSAAANSATAEPPANLLARPGFEAAEAALKTSWHPFEPGGYEVDRQEKHTGNQSIKLAVATTGVAKGAWYSLPPDQIKTPGSILVSAWSKAQDVSGSKDDAYAIYIDVSQIIVYAINLNREPVEVVLQTKPGACRANELITGQTVPTDKPLTLMPRRPMLLEIGDVIQPSQAMLR